MSEQQLKEFGARAERLVDVPDFAELDRRGRDLRVRRRAGVATALAVVLAAAGATVWQAQRGPVKHEPIGPPHVRSYPGDTMKDLTAGSYRLHPSKVASDLTAEFTLPAGWNAWIGPNRFDGHAPGRSNSDALGHSTWYVGALVLEVDSVNTRGCGDPWNHLVTTRAVVRALTRAFSMKVVTAPEQTRKFDRPATHLRLRNTAEIESCPGDSTLFHTAANGFVQYGGTGWLLDVWILDVDGRPIYVQKTWSPNAPKHVRAELDAVVDSVEITGGD
jgi:hypothetical protein